MTNVSVIVFPGSNCDHDIEHVFGKLLGARVTSVWHKETKLPKSDLLVLPGGFSFGDYLRTGAIAKLSPIMPEIQAFAAKGGPVLGVCNGFQILCETQLLPGVLLQNQKMKFLSTFVHIKVESASTPFTKLLKPGDVLRCPVAHFDGNYFADPETLSKLEGEGQVIFRYCDETGKVDPEDRESNPNGSKLAIAGICNQARNVVGLMPHPERIAENSVGYVGGVSGLDVFKSALESLA